MTDNNSKKNIKDIKLPLINQTKKNTTIKSIKTTTNKNNKDIIKVDSAKNILNEEKNKNQKKNNNLEINTESRKFSENNNNDKINEIIDNVNKKRNINTKVINDGFHSTDNNINKINKKKKYKFKIYKPLNPLLVPHEDMSFIKEHHTKENFYKDLLNKMPKMTKDKLNEIKKRRNARIKKEKLGYEFNSNKIINDIKGQNSIIKSGEIIVSDILNNINDPIKISQKYAKKILEESGIIEAYKHLIKNLCKNGMPEGNVYDYCSEYVKNFERIWQKIKFRMLNKKIEEHFKEKKKELIEKNENNISNKFFRILEQRNEMKFVKKLDKSRSSLHIIKRKEIIPKENIKNNENNNKFITIELKENKNIILDRKNSINKKNIQIKNNNQLKKLLPKSNKVTFNIKLKKNENEENKKAEIKEEIKENIEKDKIEKEIKEKNKKNSKEKVKQKKNDKGENENNSKNSTLLNNNKIDEDNKFIVKEKKNMKTKK
jgi:hypothetical protein